MGRSTSLPDCRAYELVTPESLGRTQDLLFEHGQDRFLAAGDGDHVALDALATYLEPGVSNHGTEAVLSRSPAGWTMQSIATPAMAGAGVEPELFSPDLTQVAFRDIDQLTRTGGAFAVGPVGGPYSTVASIPGTGLGSPEEIDKRTMFVGANAGTASVPMFSDIIFSSNDHELLPPGPEREAAKEARPGRADLYEWSEGRLRLVNVDSGGKALNPCGAALGFNTTVGNAINAISADGSKIFFTSPQAPGTPGCSEPQLYMRVGGGATVDVTEPEGAISGGGGEVTYDGASADGSKVFFTTATVLTPHTGGGYHLYEYDTEAPIGRRLTLIASEVESADREFVNPAVIVSEDGSAVYYEGAGTLLGHSVSGIWRYATATGRTSFVAVPRETPGALEPSSVTPDGNFLLFAAGGKSTKGVEFIDPGGLEEEPRGAHHEELYRYDALTGSVMCVSCGERVAPARGFVREPESFYSSFIFDSISPTALAISESGRRVFFQTTAKLVPQDTNESSIAEEAAETSMGAGADVYEWEADGTEEAQGVLCEVAVGCTHLISAGEAVGPERFLGASASGDDAFFTSAAQLVPQATPEFTNIYDARVDGGFSPPPPSVECTSCQGVGSPPQSFGAFASRTFAGAGNSPHATTTTTTTRLTRAEKLAMTLRACRKRPKRARAACEARARRTYGTKRGVGR